MVTDTAIANALRESIHKRIKRGECERISGLLGISRGYLSYIKNGRRSPIGVMLRLAQEMGVEVTMRIDGEDVNA